MSKNKRISQIQLELFDVISELHTNLQNKNKEDYKIWLVELDELNDEYKSLTGKFHIEPLDAVVFYEHLWNKF